MGGYHHTSNCCLLSVHFPDGFRNAAFRLRVERHAFSSTRTPRNFVPLQFYSNKLGKSLRNGCSKINGHFWLSSVFSFFKIFSHFNLLDLSTFLLNQSYCHRFQTFIFQSPVDTENGNVEIFKANFVILGFSVFRNFSLFFTFNWLNEIFHSYFGQIDY